MSRFIDVDKIDWRLVEFDNMIPAEEHMLAMAKRLIDRQPTAEVKPVVLGLTEDEIETIRIHLSAIKGELCNQHRWSEAKEYEQLINKLVNSKPVVRGENLGGGAFLCSACGFDDVAHSHTVKFCPNCGAEIINARPADEDDSGLQK